MQAPAMTPMVKHKNELTPYSNLHGEPEINHLIVRIGTAIKRLPEVWQMHDCENPFKTLWMASFFAAISMITPLFP